MPFIYTLIFLAGDFDGSPDARNKSPSPVPSPVVPAKPKLTKYGKPMKSVRWVADERLESIRYFEKEEGERGDIIFHYSALWPKKVRKGRKCLDSFCDFCFCVCVRHKVSSWRVLNYVLFCMIMSFFQYIQVLSSFCRVEVAPSR